jgi:hypothetical protein
MDDNVKKYLLLSLLIAFLNALVVLIFFFPHYNHTDTAEYFSTISHFAQNSHSPIIEYRILKPAPIFIGAALTPLVGLENSLIVQNIFFYFLAVCLIFFLVFEIYQNQKQAFYGAVIFATAYPMLAYGLASLTDLSGWVFYLLVVLFSILIYKNNPSIKKVFLLGLVGGLGMLFKENLGAAPIFFASFIFIATQIPLKEKIKHVLVFGAGFVILPLISGLIIYKFFTYSLLNWFFNNWHNSAGQGSSFAYSNLRIIIEIARVLAFGWLLFVLGFFKEFLQKNNPRKRFLLSLILPSLSFFLWSFPHNRIIFIAAPLLVLLASRGLIRNESANQKFNLAVEIILLTIYLFVNYFLLNFLLNYGTIIQPPGTIFG